MIFLTPSEYRKLKRNAKLDGLLTDPEKFVVIDDQCKLVCLHAANFAVKKSLPKTKDGFDPLDFEAYGTIGGITYVQVKRLTYLQQFIDFIFDCNCACCRHGRE